MQECPIYVIKRDRVICRYEDCGHHESYEWDMWEHLRKVHKYEVQPGLFDDKKDVLQDH